MSEAICYIVGAGNFSGFWARPKAGDYLMAADGGYLYLQKEGLEPDVVLGDFDSLKQKPEHREIIELPAEKDDTDMLYALRLGLEKGYKTFHLYGGMGGRFEHTLANLQSLGFLAEQGAVGYLFGQTEVTTVIKNGRARFDENAKGYFSLFSLSERCAGVSITGLKYELADALLTQTFPIGVSNEFIGKKSEILIQQGAGAMVFAQENLSCVLEVHSMA